MNNRKKILPTFNQRCLHHIFKYTYFQKMQQKNRFFEVGKLE